MNEFFYKVNEKEYLVVVEKKRIKNIYYRFDNGVFKVSCGHGVLKSQIIKGLDKYAVKMIKRSERPNPKTDDYFYLFGVKVDLEESGEISFTNDRKIIYKSKDDLDKKLHKMFLEILKERVAYYSNVMNLPLYKVSLKNMKTRFGSNSSYTKTLHFSYMLIHFSYEIIDSVIVHELAHILVHDHSKKFYDVVYKYCPNYKIYRKKLIRGEYQ